jgi:UDP-2,3-diacylglucosamine hydrolase
LNKEKLYFASDFHLGIPDYESSLAREKLLVNWLEEISGDATAIFLMGDIFDFWFEYKQVVPKGYVRLLGALAKITDAGIPVHIFKGNHDLWAFDYLENEVGVILHRKFEIFEFDGKRFFLAHGDGLGPGDYGYKFLKSIFENKVNQFLFRWLHPDVGISMGLFFSRRSRLAKYIKGKKINGKIPVNKEMLYLYAEKMLERYNEIDYFVFGHNHRIVHENINEHTQIVILGDWLSLFSYAVFSDGKLTVRRYMKDETD